jgi:hypothetical protein
MDGGRIVLHIVPVAGFDSPDGVELSLASVRPLPLLGGANYHRYNFDGVLVFDEMNEQSGERRCSRYAQVFRHGSIEAADTELLSQSRSQVRPNPDAIPSVYFEGKLIEWLASYLKNLLDWGVPGPLLVALSLLNVKGFKMLSQGIDMLYYSAAPIDRDDLLTSEVLVEDFEKDDLKSQAQRILRGPLDQIWQAAGYLGSPNFDKTGAWTGKL